MMHEPSRLRVAIADPTSFGQSTLIDLVMDEGVRDIAKFSSGRDVVFALLKEQFDLIIVDDELPGFSASEIAHLAPSRNGAAPCMIAVQSRLAREDVNFLRENGVAGVVLKPIAPKRFSSVFRSLFRLNRAANLAA